MEWIASLDFEKIANAIIILLTGFLAAFGFRRRAPEKTEVASPVTSTVELAGALVDSTSVKALAGSIEGHSLALVETRAETREVRACLDKLTDATEEASRSLIEVRDELRELRGEMRAGRR